jgi:hypothetical protein
MSEPIAWTNKENLKYLQVARHANIWNQSVAKKDIPLYMHPKIWELTDEEIMQIWQDSDWGNGEEEDILFFAKLLLKKASEK